MSPNLVCDATAIKYPMTGVQHAVLNQVMALARALGKDRLRNTLVAPPLPQLGPLPDNASLYPKPPPSENPLRRILWQQLRLPDLLRSLQADCLHAFAYTAPWNCPVPYLLNVHDLIPLQHPELCAARNLCHMRALLPHSVRHAAMSLTSTRHGADSLMRLLQVPADRIEVIHLGVDAAFYASPAAYPPSLPQGCPYVLFLSNIEPKKDLDTLLDAYAMAAPRLREHLVIVGRQAWKAQRTCRRLSRWQGPGTVHWLHYVPQEQVPALYQHASAFVMPSITEGFGLPILEAMAAGTPVIHSSHPALMETAGNAGLSFPVGDAEALARLLQRLLASPQLQSQCVHAGRARAARMTWERWGSQAAEALRKILHS